MEYGAELQQIEQLLEEFEVTYGKYHYGHTKPLHEAITLLHSLNDPRAEDVRRDIALFDLITPLDKATDRFKPMVSGTDGQGQPWCYPDLANDFPEDALPYYASRMEKTTNYALRAIYADFLWLDKRWRPKLRIRYAEVAIDSYIQASDVFYVQGDPVQAIDGVCRAIDLALRIGNDERIKDAVGYAGELLKKLESGDRKDQRWVLELIEYLARQLPKLSQFIEPDVLIRSATEAIARTQDDSERFNVERLYLGVLIDAYSALKKPEESQKCRIRRAETFIEEAQAKSTYPSGNMIAASLYEDALQAYIEAGVNGEKLDTLKVKIRESNGLARSEYSVLSFPIEIEHAVIEQKVDIYRDLAIQEALQHLSYDTDIFLSVAEATERAKRHLSEHVFASIAPLRLQKGDLTIKTLRTDEEKLVYNIGWNMMFQANIASSAFLVKTLDALIQRCDNFWRDGVGACLASKGLFSPLRLLFVQNGVTSYLAGDYVSSIHVLVFQIEGVLRDLLSKLGMSTFTYRGEQMRERDLGDVLDHLEKIQGADLDFFKFVRYFLHDATSVNLRNEVAHGIATSDTFSQETAALLIVLLLRISTYGISKTSEQDSKGI